MVLAVGWASLAFFFVDFLELKNSKAMGASKLENFFDFVVHYSASSSQLGQSLSLSQNLSQERKLRGLPHLWQWL